MAKKLTNVQAMNMVPRFAEIIDGIYGAGHVLTDADLEPVAHGKAGMRYLKRLRQRLAVEHRAASISGEAKAKELAERKRLLAAYEQRMAIESGRA